MKPFVTVTMTLHGEVEKEVSDYVDNGGKFVPLGTEVLAMLERHEVVHYKDESGVETIIPFDSVMTYNTTKESQEYTKPEDAFCKADSPLNGLRELFKTGVLAYDSKGICMAALLDVIAAFNGTLPSGIVFSGMFDGVYVNNLTLGLSEVQGGSFKLEDTATGKYVYRAIDDETGDYAIVAGGGLTEATIYINTSNYLVGITTDTVSISAVYETNGSELVIPYPCESPARPVNVDACGRSIEWPDDNKFTNIDRDMMIFCTCRN